MNMMAMIMKQVVLASNAISLPRKVRTQWAAVWSTSSGEAKEFALLFNAISSVIEVDTMCPVNLYAYYKYGRLLL